jgi:PAS domain-containing protein
VREACQYEDVDHALGTILRLIAEAHGWRVAEAWIVRDDRTALELALPCYCRDEAHRPFVDAARGFAISPGLGLPGCAWQSRQPLATWDVRDEPRFARAIFARDFGIRGALSIPVSAGAEPAAVLSFFDTYPRDVDTPLVKIVARVGRDIASLVRRRQERLERRLQETERRYRTLFERSPVGVFVAGTDSTITDGNVALAKILGAVVRTDVIGQAGDSRTSWSSPPSGIGSLRRFVSSTRSATSRYDSATMTARCAGASRTRRWPGRPGAGGSKARS